MMPVVRISDGTWERLKTWAEPLEDTADDALRKVLDIAERHRELSSEARESKPRASSGSLRRNRTYRVTGVHGKAKEHKEYAGKTGTANELRDALIEDGVLTGRGKWGAIADIRSLLDLEEIVGKPGSENQAGQQKLKRLPAGLKVPGADYYPVIMQVLYERGGKAPTEELIEAVGSKIKARLNVVDYQVLPSGELRWRKTAAFGLTLLKRQGFLANPERGLWVLTDHGIRQVEK